MNVVSLFAGIGGLELGLGRAGMTVVGQVEIDEFCRRVLTKHWPDVPKHDDVRTAPAWWQSQTRPPVDLVTGGFPCQPVSNAGLQLAQEDERWLWEPMRDVAATVQPEWVLFENVSGLRTRGLRIVLADLRDLGYRVRVGTLSACAVGAPHTRERLFGLAHAPRFRRERWGSPRPDQASLEHEGRRPEQGRTWTAEPRPHGVAYGVPARMDRLRAVGNAVVPQVGEHIGRLIMAADAQQADAA